MSAKSLMTEDDRAWNNFVMLSDESNKNEIYRSAAIANLYMGGANSGGINSFLTSTPHLSGHEVLTALADIGADIAAKHLTDILQKLGEPLARSTAEDRWNLLDRCWCDELEDLDVLSQEADSDLMASLWRHVISHKAYYNALGDTH
ncbi:hypothetical protein [Sphingopyxis macrogoltabida]|uniref:Methionyl-tRNA formyltransferase n=1 Tax=Sphingopyxis macrogoltabida TaxID=33050 RepID=A0AAC8Z317_SPHMC|nr:hypothetical protein [Sphingopyxis macrogoltabida]ALJ14370.1 methionyl-tRNA formyltransferase [Sphingopyxis macrogoltabida]AMU90637.1 methionyl-tRNA formyltransferase [Sphingopyxis macrogoltabida]